MAGQSQTPANRCYVELPTFRQDLSNKKARAAAISQDVVRTSRGKSSSPPILREANFMEFIVGGIKRSRNVVMSSSEDEYSEGTKRM